MHLADAFIQSDLHCIQVTVSTFLLALAFPGNRTHDLSVANAMLYQLSYRKAVGLFVGCCCQIELNMWYCSHLKKKSKHIILYDREKRLTPTNSPQ